MDDGLVGVERRPCADSQPAQRPLRRWPPILELSSPRERQPMSQDPADARPTGLAPQIAARQRNRARIRTVTMAAGLASLVAAGGVATSLPGSAHATAASQSRSATSSGSSAGKSASSSSSGLQSSAAPSSSSGSSHVTSGGS